MKNLRLIRLLVISTAVIFALNTSSAQDKKTGKVTLKIEEEGKTVVDTVFDLQEGQDPEHIKKMISHLTGGDGEEMVFFSEDDGEHKVMAFSSKDGDATWHMKDIDEDAIHEMHGSKNVWVYSDDDDDDFEWVSKEGHGSEDVYVIKSEDGKDVKVITKKKVVHGDLHEHEDEDVKVYVIESSEKDGVKTIRVEVEIDDEGECDEGDEKKAEKEVKVEKEVKKKKKK